MICGVCGLEMNWKTCVVIEAKRPEELLTFLPAHDSCWQDAKAICAAVRRLTKSEVGIANG